MAYSKTTELDLSNLCFSPEKGNTLCEKLTDCYRQFAEKYAEEFSEEFNS